MTTRSAQAMGALAIACTLGAWAGCDRAEDGDSNEIAPVHLVPHVAAPPDEAAPPPEARPPSPPEVAEDLVDAPPTDPVDATPTDDVDATPTDDVDAPPTDAVDEVPETPPQVEARPAARRRPRDSAPCPECTGPRVTLRTYRQQR